MEDRLEVAARASYEARSGVSNSWELLNSFYQEVERSWMRHTLSAADEVTTSALEALAASWEYEYQYCEPGDRFAEGKGAAAEELRTLIAKLAGK